MGPQEKKIFKFNRLTTKETSKIQFEGSYSNNRPQGRKNGLVDPPKLIMKICSNGLRCRPTMTCFRSSQIYVTIRDHY